MPGYLPLCAFRQGLLPDTCRSCVWWLTSPAWASTMGTVPGNRLSSAAAPAVRRRWMTSLEHTWGMTGLLLEGGGIFASAPTPAGPTPTGPASSAPAPISSRGGAPRPDIVASIQFAPCAAVPRLRDLAFGPMPDGSALIFCLTCTESQPRYQPKRVLHKALSQLKARGIHEVYAVATTATEGTCVGLDGDRCRFFPLDLLVDSGFQPVKQTDALLLMRVDLRGLLSVIGRAAAAIRQAIGHEPTPSPAAWTVAGQDTH